VEGVVDDEESLVRTDAPTVKDAAEATTEADEGDFLLPVSASRALTPSDVEGMSDHDLYLVRSEIYARHGFVFEDSELNSYFGAKSWYAPAGSFAQSQLSDLERKNVCLMLSIEQARGTRYL
jgi:hypothetical protein